MHDIDFRGPIVLLLMFGALLGIVGVKACRYVERHVDVVWVP